MYSDIFIEIAKHSDFITKLRLKQLNKNIYNKIIIKKIPQKYSYLLYDKILSYFPNLQSLHASGNLKITDDGTRARSAHRGRR